MSRQFALPVPLQSLRRDALTLAALAAIYEGVARSGYFPPALMPTPGTAHTLLASLADGTMMLHAAATLYRVLAGFALAVAIGLPLGVMMGRFRPVENFVPPMTSALMPIPTLAWVPVFILWFGPGNTVSCAISDADQCLVGRAINPIWLRAAGAMGADERALFWKVIIPGASPFIITGLRQSFLRAWIAVIGAEMLAGSNWGLGWVIFDAKEFLDTDVMLASLIVIGCIGFATVFWLDRTRHHLPLGHGALGERLDWNDLTFNLVIASETKQSRNQTQQLDCFVAFATRNDESAMVMQSRKWGVAVIAPV